MNYKESIAKFAELASKFKWEGSAAGLEHCWSNNRESIDKELVTDDIIEEFGNLVEVDRLGEAFVLTVGNYLYAADREWVEKKHECGARVLLRRANWDNIVLREDGTIAFRKDE